MIVQDEIEIKKNKVAKILNDVFLYPKKGFFLIIQGWINCQCILVAPVDKASNIVLKFINHSSNA